MLVQRSGGERIRTYRVDTNRLKVDESESRMLTEGFAAANIVKPEIHASAGYIKSGGYPYGQYHSSSNSDWTCSSYHI